MIKNFSSVVIGCYPSLFSVACSNEKSSLIIMRMLFWLDYKTYEQTHRNSLLMEHGVTNQKIGRQGNWNYLATLYVLGCAPNEPYFRLRRRENWNYMATHNMPAVVCVTGSAAHKHILGQINVFPTSF